MRLLAAAIIGASVVAACSYERKGGYERSFDGPAEDVRPVALRALTAYGLAPEENANTFVLRLPSDDTTRWTFALVDAELVVEIGAVSERRSEVAVFCDCASAVSAEILGAIQRAALEVGIESGPPMTAQQPPYPSDELAELWARRARSEADASAETPSER